MQQTIAKVKSTHLGYEDHGIFSVAINFDYGGSGQGWGPISLGKDDSSVAGPVIEAVLKACGVDSWEKLVGRTVYAIRDNDYNGLVRGLAPLPTERGEGFTLKDGKVIPYQVEP